MNQLQALNRARTILEKTYAHLFLYLRSGLTERQVVREINKTMRVLGMEKNAFRTIVASGPDGAEPHHVGGSRKLRNGDLVVLDFGPKINGWCADQTRTVVIGKPTELQRKRYELVRRAQHAAIHAVRAGVESSHIDRVARKILNHAGYRKRFIHSTGHGLGKAIHQPPWFTPNPKRSRKLQVGEIVTVEPGLYVPGWGGIRIEDMVLVTRNGHRVLDFGVPTALSPIRT